MVSWQKDLDRVKTVRLDEGEPPAGQLQLLPFSIVGIIEGVACDGAAQAGQVDPDLVSSAGLQAHQELGGSRSSLKHLVVGDGPQAIWANHSFSLVIGILANGQINRAGVRQFLSQVS